MRAKFVNEKKVDKSKDYFKRAASFSAFTDISQYLEENPEDLISHPDEVWQVTPTHMNTKETRRLNKELGIHVINRGPHNMTRKKKNKEESK